MIKRIKKIFCLFCFLQAGILFLFAEESTKTVLTVEDAVEKGLQSHVDVQRSSLTMNQSQRNYSHSWNKVLPDISVSGTGAEKNLYKDTDTDTLSLNAGVSA